MTDPGSEPGPEAGSFEDCEHLSFVLNYTSTRSAFQFLSDADNSGVSFMYNTVRFEASFLANFAFRFGSKAQVIFPPFGSKHSSGGEK